MLVRIFKEDNQSSQVPYELTGRDQSNALSEKCSVLLWICWIFLGVRGAKIAADRWKLQAGYAMGGSLLSIAGDHKLDLPSSDQGQQASWRLGSGWPTTSAAGKRWRQSKLGQGSGVWCGSCNRLKIYCAVIHAGDVAIRTKLCLVTGHIPNK